MGKLKSTLKTVTRSGVPNVNGVTYSEEAFKAMVEKVRPLMENGAIYLTRKDYCMVNVDPMNVMKFTTIFPEDVLGTVTDIRDGEIDVEIILDKFVDFDQYIIGGYEPCMRYLAKVDGGQATNLTLICYDMVKLPERFKRP